MARGSLSDQMHITRRHWLLGASALALFCSARSAATEGTAGLSKRSIININSFSIFQYAFIDHFKEQDQWGPVGSAWASGKNFNAMVDTAGYPNSRLASDRPFGGGVRVPSSVNYSGSYILDGFGTGRIRLLAGAWKPVARTNVRCSVSNDAVISATGTDTSRWSVQLLYAGPAHLIPYSIDQTSSGPGGYPLNGLRLYRSDDAADLAAGKVFRTPYKQALVDLAPSAIRFMDWNRANDSKECRFENRKKPDYASYATDHSYWNAGPRYLDTSGHNQMLLDAAPGMPTSMQHGEIALCRISASGGMIRTNQAASISEITRANPGVVTAARHGYLTKDQVVHAVPSANGMAELDSRVCTITVITPDTYSIGIDTSRFSAFKPNATLTGRSKKNSAILSFASVPQDGSIAAGFGVVGPGVPAGALVSKSTRTTITLSAPATTEQTDASFIFSDCRAKQFISLNVGGRGAYPVIFTDGSSSASQYGDDYLKAGDYKTFYFDKTIAAQKDNLGKWMFGVWMFNNGGSTNGHQAGVPTEICTALVNELNAMKPVQPIHMWITIPHWAMLSMDPDYSEASNFATNTVDLILNGSSGYAGLNNRCNLFVEYSNETWNSAGTQFSQTPYLARRGNFRWPASTSGDYVSMVSLRSCLMCRDIQSAFPANQRIKLILAGQGTQGIGPGTLNYLRAFGGSANFFTNDALNPRRAAAISYHHGFAWAGYVFNDDSVPSNSLAQCTADFVAARGSPELIEAACAKYVGGIKSNPSKETIDYYYKQRLPEFAAAMRKAGKWTCMYEGGWDHEVSEVGNPQSVAFLKACKRSRAYAAALKNAHASFDHMEGAYMPADYVELDARWGHLEPDAYAFNKGGIEWSGLDESWLEMGRRNRLLEP